MTTEPYKDAAINLLDATQKFMEEGQQLNTVVFPETYEDPLRQLRRVLLDEEYYSEYLAAESDNNLVEIVDGLLDIIVIAWGTLLTYVGPDKAKACAAEVAWSNLSKVIGPGLPIFREDGKIMKPPGWVGPNIAAILEA